MNWVDNMESKQSGDYFNVVEGENKFFLLSHTAPLAQRWTGSKYEIAEEGDDNISIKGVCWVLQDNVIKSARLPYTVVKALRAYMLDDEWDLGEFPWKHQVTLTAKGAGTKEVEYSVTLSPKAIEFDAETLKSLAEKPSPEEMIEKFKEKSKETKSDYPTEEEGGIKPEDVPF